MYWEGSANELGSIEKGKLADMIVIDRNIVELSKGEDTPPAIAEIQVDSNIGLQTSWQWKDE